MFKPKFQIYREADNKYYINLQNSDGQLMFVSKGFNTRYEALEFLDMLKISIFNACPEDLTSSIIVPNVA